MAALPDTNWSCTSLCVHCTTDLEAEPLSTKSVQNCRALTASGESSFFTYEFIEWCTALAGEEGAEAFLGTQGDPWDTQWDMFLAGCGAIAAQFLFERMHDRQMAAVDPAVADKVRPRA